MNKSDRIKPYYPIIFALVLIGGMYFGAVLMTIKFSSYKNIKQSLFSVNFSYYDKIYDVLNYISDSYVDPVEREELIDIAITGLLKRLDPHSSYITAKDFQRMNEPLMGNFEGIGVEFRIEQDTVVVLNTISGGPSEKVGIRAGDRIVKVNDSVIAGVGIANQDVVDMLKGPKNTQVRVSVARRQIEELIDFTIIRDIIPTFSVDIAYMVDERTAYVKINRFSATTYNEFRAAVTELQLLGMQALIIDLRGNGGGYLNAAIQMADEFLEHNCLIVYTEGLNRPRAYAYATAAGRLKQTPVAVLIDEWSASASEVFSGALQDNDRGVIIGRRSFGKGLVQEQIQLMDGSALRLTVARYYTPLGRSIQTPYTDDVGSYYMNFYRRLLEDAADEQKQPHDTVEFITPEGNIVYGGGGITPDIIVPHDDEKYSAYYRALLNRGLIFRFAFQYVDNNRDSLLDLYETHTDFYNNFAVTAHLQSVFNNFVEDEGVVEDKTDEKDDTHIIQKQLKAYIGRNLFGNESFFPLFHKTDAIFLRAIDYLNAEMDVKKES